MIVLSALPLSRRTKALTLSFLLLLALITRYGALGDGNFWEDEQLFLHVGQRMVQGGIPYVDVWDRKPAGLFALYALFAAITTSPWLFQLAALLAVVGTAYALARLTTSLSDSNAAGLVAGGLYIVALLPFDGRSGEAGVFAALPMAWAALLIITGKGQRRGWIAMLLAGLAITIKQTTLFEGIWLGFLLLWQSRFEPASQRLKSAALWIIMGAAPMLLIGLFYAANGHFAALWQAMVGANLHKAYNPGGDLLHRYGLVARLLLPLLGMAALGWRKDAQQGWWLVLGWLGAALIGMAAIPNMLGHYTIPVLAPLAVLAGVYAGRSWLGIGLAVIWGVVACGTVQVWDFGRATRSNALLERADAAVQMHQAHPRLFVFDGPMALYQGKVTTPPTPLIFPLHLSYLPERDVSQFSSAPEVAKVLAWHPDVVVVQERDPRGSLINPETAALVSAYLQQCRWRDRLPLLNASGPYWIVVHSGCSK